MWDLPRAETEPVSPALADIFFTTTPRESLTLHFEPIMDIIKVSFLNNIHWVILFFKQNLIIYIFKLEHLDHLHLM